jgi:hypothetical protein
MKILAVAYVQPEQRQHTITQFMHQTVQPDATLLFVDDDPADGIDARRKRIADNQHHIKRTVSREYTDYDVVFQIEGDAVLPDDALERLVAQYEKRPAIYSGIQVGRHGIYCIGAWHVNDDRTEFQSIDPSLTGIHRVDAMGLYCFIMPTKHFIDTPCWWDGERYGPDVNFFLSTPLKKYVVMDVEVGHKTATGIIRPSDPSTCVARFYMVNNEWRFEQL